MNQSGQLHGALFDLRLAGIDEANKHPAIGLTEAGLEFAKLENPVIDKGDLSAALSDAEIDFYLHHIREHVPGEVYAFQLVLGLIVGGVTSPKALDEGIAEHVKWSRRRGFVSTQRAGTVSRLFELKMIDKTRQGRRVTYEVTDRGQNWLEIGGETNHEV